MFFIPKHSWEIRKTSKKGRGVFATEPILPGTIIGDYLGKVVRPEEEEAIQDERNFYLMYYHDHASLYPNLRKPGIHLLNHSCAPNCFMTTYKGHTLFFALRQIFPGEELTISYLLSPQDDTCTPCTHRCHCESINCTESMHLTKKRYNEWSVFTDKESKATKRERIRYGKYLQPLTTYPETIPDNLIYPLFGAHGQPDHTVDDPNFPPLTTVRALLRQHGRVLVFPKLHLRIFGVMDDTLYTKQISV